MVAPSTVYTALLLAAGVIAPARAVGDRDFHSLARKRELIASRYREKYRLDSEVNERIRSAQVNPHAVKHVRHRVKRGPSATITSTTATATETSGTCGVVPARGPDTSACSSQSSSDGCTDPIYSVSAAGVTINSGSIPANGDINFQYILCSDYKGTGSKRSQPSNWNVMSGGLHFDPNNNQPGTPYIGKTYFPFSAGASLPSCYCVIWVGYSAANQHFGEGGQAPYCGCASASGGGAGSGSGSSGATTTVTTPTSAATTTALSTTKPATTATTSSTTANAAACSGSGLVLIPGYGQCGGIGYTGSPCCASGFICSFSNDYYSQCIPGVLSILGQSSTTSTASSIISTTTTSTKSSTSTAATSLSASCSGSAGAYSQCGGIGFSGGSCCVSGYTCVYSNDYYSQCLPGASSTSATAGTVTTSSTISASLTTSTGTTKGTTAATTTAFSSQGTSTSPTSTTSLAQTTGTCGAVPARGPDTSSCSNQNASDGCTDPVYSVSAPGVTINSGSLPANGHINFQFIACSDYKGTGSKRSQPSNWNVMSGGLHFDPNNNQPGTPYIGKTYFPFSAGANLPSCYCVIWVQYSEANQHFGEGGQAPYCGCASNSVAGSGSGSAATTTAVSSPSPTTKATTTTSTTAATTTSATAKNCASQWGQCGGIGWTGPTCCVAGSTCIKSNDWYSQCQ